MSISKLTSPRPGITLLVFIFILLIFSLTARAQQELNSATKKLPRESPTIRFEHMGLEDGLQQGNIMDIMQDRQGFLWLTTQDGLHRYDGYEFKIFTSIPFDTTSLSSSQVMNVHEASSGDLWVTTPRHGLNKMNRTTGTFTHYKYNPEDSTSLSDNYLYDVMESEKGDIWVSTRGGGLNFMAAGEDGKFQRLRHDPENLNSLTSNRLFYISEDAKGNIWVGSPTGLNKIETETKVVTRFLHNPKETNSSDSPVVAMAYHPQNEPGIAWLATSRGIIRLNKETGDHESFMPEENNPRSPKNFFYRIIPDPSLPNILWVAGPGAGVARFDMTTESFTSYLNDPRDPNSLREDETYSLYADRSGTMWAGHRSQGLSKFNPEAINFFHLKHDPDNPNSLAYGLVWGLYEDSWQTLWAGINSQAAYLNRIDPNGEIRRYKGSFEDKSSLPTGLITSFAEDSSGGFWIGTTDGLCLMDRDTEQVSRFFHLPVDENYLRNEIYSIVPDPNAGHLLWMGSSGGLDLFNTITREYKKIEFLRENSEKNPNIFQLLFSINGNLWVASSQGLFRVGPSVDSTLAFEYNPKDTTTISSNEIFTMLERDKEPGILWLGTERGLNRFNTLTGKATHYTTKEGLPNNIIYGILEDSNGTLWMSTNRGISNFNPEEGIFRNYGLDDGLVALEYNQFAYTKGLDGMMYFGSSEGITGFIPENLANNNIPPQVVLSGLKLFNKPLEPGPGSLLKQPLSETQKITLDHNQNELTFDFVALHYANPEKNSYAYMLEGYDKEWVQAGNRRIATYTNLSPGSYIFKVKAANADGIWSEDEASLQLEILPPWYRTWWAYFLFAILLIAFVLGVDHLQRRKIRIKEKERATLREAELRAEAENKRRTDTEHLSKIGQTVTSTLSVPEIIERVYEHVNELLDAAIFGIGIYNEVKKRLDFPATKEKGLMLSPYSYKLKELNRLAVWCFINNKEIIISNAGKEMYKYVNMELPSLEGKDSKSIIFLPLTHQGKTIGVITTQSFKENAYNSYHVELLRNLATYAAIALDNAAAYRKLDSTLIDLKVMQEQLVQQEKLASLGNLTAGIAHEIKNPLNFVNNFSELSVELIDEAREELTQVRGDDENSNLKLTTVSEILGDIEMNLQKIYDHGTRADGIVKSMLQHSRGGTGKMEPMDLNALIQEYVSLSYHGMRAAKAPINVKIDMQLDENIEKVPLIQEDFGRVIVNLCNNAFEAMREQNLSPSVNGNYLPKLSVRTKKQKTGVQIEIEDNGTGIPKDLWNKIMQPFFTTKKGTSGSGLGLSIAHDIVHSHGGTLSLKSSEPTGTCFTVNLPKKK